MGKWKAIRAVKTDKIELYNLDEDLGETNEIAEKHPDVVAKIRACLKVARTENEHWKLPKVQG